MKRLVRPHDAPVSYLDRYVEIRDSKHMVTRVPLTEAHPVIEAQYAAYINAMASGAIHTLAPCPDCAAVAEPLRACYDSHTKALGKLKKDIREAQPPRQLKYCPMCGITLPRSFDHYAPAVKFPEYSVFACNLVPVCSECNSIKDDDWLLNGSRQYLHAYLDELPDVPFLVASLHEDPQLAAPGVSYSLAIPAAVPPAQAALIQSHFDRLHLIRRYDELGNDEIAEIIADCRIFVAVDGADPRAFLIARAAERRAIHGRNHWRLVLMETLATHAKFLDWIG